MLDTPPAVRFVRITDPTRRHAFFWASAAEDFDRVLAAYDCDDELTAEPCEFTEPDIIAATQAWLIDQRRENDRPGMVMVGSVENGQWVNWNLEAVPRPPVPSF